jgi:hypothetical protein
VGVGLLRLCLVLALLAGCSFASGSRRAETSVESPGGARLVVYRPYHFVSSGIPSNLIVDGGVVGTVQLNGAWSVSLAPGSHSIGIDGGSTPYLTNAELLPDVVSYWRITPELGGFSLRQVDPREGRVVVAGLSLQGETDLASARAVRPPVVAAAVSAAATSGELPRMLVMSMRGDGLDAATKETMTQLLVTYLSASRTFFVLSNKDIEQLVNLNAERQTLDCGTEACLAEIGNAYGARYVAYPQASKLGELYLINMSLFDVEKAVPVGREVAQARSLSDLPTELEAAAARLVARSPR